MTFDIIFINIKSIIILEFLVYSLPGAEFQNVLLNILNFSKVFFNFISPLEILHFKQKLIKIEFYLITRKDNRYIFKSLNVSTLHKFLALNNCSVYIFCWAKYYYFLCFTVKKLKKIILF